MRGCVYIEFYIRLIKEVFYIIEGSNYKRKGTRVLFIYIYLKVIFMYFYELKLAIRIEVLN